VGGEKLRAEQCMRVFEFELLGKLNYWRIVMVFW
jgi:hypothetical protein